MASGIATWIVCAGAIACMLLRPRAIPEWVWAASAALLLVALRLLDWHDALGAVVRGTGVYAFLIGMMLLAEVARVHGVFAWLAGHAVGAAGSSQDRLFALVYVVGVAVTVFLSNDATAVVLTPAIVAVVRRAGVAPLPYVFACAFVANAASFVLPISNPANLVAFGEALPQLAPWLRAFGLPSVLAIVATYAALRILSHRALRGELREAQGVAALGRGGRAAVAVVAVASVGLVATSWAGGPLGAATLLFGGLALLVTLCVDRATPAAALRGVTWSIVPLVAGLFVLVQALDASGALGVARRFLAFASSLPHVAGNLAAMVAVTVAANVANNLPIAVVAGLALHGTHVAPHVAHAAVVAVDLGPNLSVSGSLATLLWLAALRREGIVVTPLRFLGTGAVVLVPALFLCALALQ